MRETVRRAIQRHVQERREGTRPDPDVGVVDADGGHLFAPLEDITLHRTDRDGVAASVDGTEWAESDLAVELRRWR